MSSQPTCRSRRSRGSAYLAVLAAALVVAAIGIGAVAVARTQVRQAVDARDELAARALALSAAEHALVAIDADPNWRTSFEGRTIEHALDGGTLSWQLTDPDDGDLDDDLADNARLLASGRRGLAQYVLAYELLSDGGPGSATVPAGARTLGFGPVSVGTSGQLNLDGGRLLADAAVTNDGTITGDVQAPSVSGSGTVSGTISNDPVTTPEPEASVVDDYIALATAIPTTTQLRNTVLAPGYNPWGVANPDGVYYLECGNVVVRDLRVHGTLIIRSTGLVQIKGPILFERARDDYPALIVDGNLEVDYTGGAGALTEGGGRNLNVAGAPYNGQTDSDTSDTYPALIRGLVHATGDVTFKRNSDVYGLVLAQGNLSISGTLTVHADPVLEANPPPGYFGGTGAVTPTGCARVVE